MNKTMTYIIFLIIITTLHCVWHYSHIIKYNGMDAGFKAFTILITSVLVIVIGFILLRIGFLAILPFSVFLVWLIKDSLLGWWLHGDIFYLGTGKFDRLVYRMMQGGKVAFFFKLFCLAFCIGLFRYV